MNAALLMASALLVVGGLLLSQSFLSHRPPSLTVRLARAEGRIIPSTGALDLPEPLRTWIARVSARYEEWLRQAGKSEGVAQLMLKKLLFAIALPLVPLLPYAVAVRQVPSPVLILLLAVVGFFLPDLALRADARKRREALFLDLPEAIAVMSLSLRSGQSLRQALELAARDCEGPLGEELTRALSLARRDRTLDEREALVAVSQQAGEPALARFAELLAAKESPYVDFLRTQARELRAEQNRYLERAADRAYLSMHAPVVPLLAVLVLLVAYGFIHFLAQTV